MPASQAAVYGGAVPRLLRTSLPDGFFHVTARGVDGAVIYLDDRDRWSFLGLLRDAIVRYRLTCHTYCLMTNHYHLLLRAAQPDLSRGLQLLNGVHAQRFNRRHERTGHLFGQRFSSKVVEDDEYLYDAAEYILQNPVRAGLCDDPRDYPWARSDL